MLFDRTLLYCQTSKQDDLTYKTFLRIHLLSFAKVDALMQDVICITWCKLFPWKEFI